MEAKQFLKKIKHIAIVGATTNHEKYGYKVFHRLNQLGYNTHPISPIYKEIDGILTYENLSQINKSIDLVVFVTAPKYTIDYLHECLSLNIHNLWFQPHTYDMQVLDFVEEHSFNYYLNCILVETEEN